MVAHIPDKHFKMTRYYGFFSNQKRGEQLPKVYTALESALGAESIMPSYAAMLKGYVNVDPYECILCGNRMNYTNFRSGTPLAELVSHAIMSSKVRPA